MFSHEQYQALRTGAGLLDRSARGRLRLTGADRRAYLHGVLTNDIEAMRSGLGCYAALLTRQGRMISDMRVSELGDAVLIDLPASTADAVRQQLADLIFSEDVEVHDARGTHAQVGLYGPQSAELLSAVLTSDASTGSPSRELLEAMPIGANTSAPRAGSTVVIIRSDDYGPPGFELFVDVEHLAGLVGALREAGAVPVESEAVDVVRVESGRPEFGVDMDEETIPLEAGIEDRAISMTKGCYVGQEVIVRVLHRGHGRVAKHLVGFIAEPGARPMRRGEAVHVDEKGVGVVTSAATSPRLGRAIGLGYVRREHAAPGQLLRIGSPGDFIDAAVAPVPFIPPTTG